MIYEEITNKFTNKKQYRIEKQTYYMAEDGIKYNIDGKHVILDTTEKEVEVAELVGEILGGDIKIIPKVNEPEGIKTPDYIINGEKFDLKEIRGNSKNTLYDALGKQKRQANNFIFDISNTKMNKEEAIRQIRNIYLSRNRRWVQMLILIENKEILKIYRKIKVDCNPI